MNISDIQYVYIKHIRNIITVQTDEMCPLFHAQPMYKKRLDHILLVFSYLAIWFYISMLWWKTITSIGQSLSSVQ